MRLGHLLCERARPFVVRERRPADPANQQLPFADLGELEDRVLLRRVTVRPKLMFTGPYPKEMPRRITIQMDDGRLLHEEESGDEGFQSRRSRLRIRSTSRLA